MRDMTPVVALFFRNLGESLNSQAQDDEIAGLGVGQLRGKTRPTRTIRDLHE